MRARLGSALACMLIAACGGRAERDPIEPGDTAQPPSIAGPSPTNPPPAHGALPEPDPAFESCAPELIEACADAKPQHIQTQAELDELRGIEQVCDLELTGNQLLDLSPLAALRSARSLSIDSALAPDLPLAALERVEQLLELRNIHRPTRLDLRRLGCAAQIKLTNNSGLEAIELASPVRVRELTLAGDSIARVTGSVGGEHLDSLLLSSPVLSDLGFVSGLRSMGGVSILRSTALADLDDLAGLTRVSTLILEGNAFHEIVMPGLQVVQNRLEIDDLEATQVSFPSLTSIGDALELAGIATRALSFPRLTDVGGALLLYENPNLEDLSVPVLARAGKVFVSYNDAIERLSFPALTRSALIEVTENLGLVEVSFPVLGNESAVSINHHPLLEQVTIGGDGLSALNVNSTPNLERVFANLSPSASNFSLIDSPLLTSVELPGVEGLSIGFSIRNTGIPTLDFLNSLRETEVFTLTGNPELHSLGELENLERVGKLTIQSNKALSNCEALSLRSRIDQIDGVVLILDNGDDACD